MTKKHKTTNDWATLFAESMQTLSRSLHVSQIQSATTELQDGNLALEKYNALVKEAELSMKSAKQAYDELIVSVTAADKALQSFLGNYNAYKLAAQEIQSQEEYSDESCVTIDFSAIKNNEPN